MDEFDAVWDTHGKEGVVIRSLLPDRTIHVRAIAVLSEYNIVRLEYQITPAMAPTGGLANDDEWAAWARRNDWELTGRDSLGSELTDLGGVRGEPFPDEDLTEGERDLRPAPSELATWLDIMFNGLGYREHPPLFSIRVPLPLPSVTLEEWTELIKQYWDK